MSEKRYAIIDIEAKPMAVVDMVTINDEPGSEEHETLVVSEAYHSILSSDAQLGWIWDGESLKEPQP
jgi:hypothetical protein